MSGGESAVAAMRAVLRRPSTEYSLAIVAVDDARARRELRARFVLSVARPWPDNGRLATPKDSTETTSF